MKRTKNINKDRFRKVHSFWKYSALFVAMSAASMFLTGCDEPENVSVYQTIQDCERSAENDAAKQKCALDYQNALAQNKSTAPKYSSQRDCEDEFGVNQCTTTNSTHSSLMWFPLMSGYSSSHSNYQSQPLYSSTRYNSPFHGKFVDANGNSFGSFKPSGTASVSKSALASKPAVTTTTTRGGFGSTVSSHAAKSSSFHSSGSRSFGG
ncbi:hypothetical protein GAP32_529 [Cronobacter phage vB_CsaM_GAP32]|uniref:Uncharacterized protein n=1 Tax=Cronobacter phage vB_CsaM_GAP32 TaxID=1141136 RepID=K4F9R9_9CAUD|nr:hypothetical protein GAP32_529 [Cronobacter phage vB_CsaM_GAP32]AFC21990.1 hypothetical protein GAP32_529 [Cronobacter phage vB_CsaM_GAP32]